MKSYEEDVIYSLYLTRFVITKVLQMMHAKYSVSLLKVLIEYFDLFQFKFGNHCRWLSFHVLDIQKITYISMDITLISNFIKSYILDAK